MWPGEYPPEGHPLDRRRTDGPPRFNVAGGVSPGRSARTRPTIRPPHLGASMWPGEYPPEGPPRNEVMTDTGQRLQCGRGSIPRKVVAMIVESSAHHQSLQCGRGSIPRKVPHALTSSFRYGLGFNVAGGVSPGRSSPRLRPQSAHPHASMWPGEYPPEGRRLAGYRISRPSRASMWPGEYPPEGQQQRQLRRANRIASMWPGEYPPEGRRHSGPTSRVRGVLQCGRGSIPRKVCGGICSPLDWGATLQCGRGSIPRKVAIRPNAG